MLIHSMVSGQFYPQNPEILRLNITKMLNTASEHSNLVTPKALIAPHAGYIYSGLIASSAYACLSKMKGKIKKVVMFAPAHRYFVSGIATTTANAYETPLGRVKIDQEKIQSLSFPFLNFIEEAFQGEHSIEVHLPFLQVILDKFLLIPFLVGKSSGNQALKILTKLWGESETLIVISSDLSHYHTYHEAQILDKKTAQAIKDLNPTKIYPKNACGATAIQGLLQIAIEKEMQVEQIDLRNSGDITKNRERVVGYGAFHFY